MGTQRAVDPAQVDELASDSARGGRRGNTAIKPDVSAPGETIYSASALTGDEGVTFSGTSMAAAHVAGAMALLRQLHPAWSVEQLKALLMNTANHDLHTVANQQRLLDGPARAVPDVSTWQMRERRPC